MPIIPPIPPIPPEIIPPGAIDDAIDNIIDRIPIPSAGDIADHAMNDPQVRDTLRFANMAAKGAAVATTLNLGTQVYNLVQKGFDARDRGRTRIFGADGADFLDQYFDARNMTYELPVQTLFNDKVTEFIGNKAISRTTRGGSIDPDNTSRGKGSDTRTGQLADGRADIAAAETRAIALALVADNTQNLTIQNWAHDELDRIAKDIPVLRAGRDNDKKAYNDIFLKYQPAGSKYDTDSNRTSGRREIQTGDISRPFGEETSFLDVQDQESYDKWMNDAEAAILKNHPEISKTASQTVDIAKTGDEKLREIGIRYAQQGERVALSEKIGFAFDKSISPPIERQIITMGNDNQRMGNLPAEQTATTQGHQIPQPSVQDATPDLASTDRQGQAEVLLSGAGVNFDSRPKEERIAEIMKYGHDREQALKILETRDNIGKAQQAVSGKSTVQNTAPTSKHTDDAAFEAMKADILRQTKRGGQNA